ncbi:MAG TPA: biotin synthase BioB [Verrucomicrobiales bacterium]|nr:biotin synthase BioB [Verrucomicrobiales bacterium]
MRLSEIQTVYGQPFFRLLQQARAVHEEHWPVEEVQLCTLLSIKTGGCSEDCAYCAQSSRYATGLAPESLLDPADVLEHARAARRNGATRFCMGAAWRGIRAGTQRFENVLSIVREVSRLGMEVCVTLGQLGPEEARRLREAGVTAYNHNLDTSPEHYPNIVSTHTYDDRLATLRHARQAGMSLCCGGILGLGESVTDRLRLLEVLSEFDPPPESIPINTLMPIPGTPLEKAAPVGVFDLIRIIAAARIAMPRSRIRLSAGRTSLSQEAQAFCLFAGANSIFYGDRLLTAGNPSTQQDLQLLDQLGITPAAPVPHEDAVAASSPTF